MHDYQTALIFSPRRLAPWKTGATLQAFMPDKARHSVPKPSFSGVLLVLGRYREEKSLARTRSGSLVVH